MRFSKKQVMEQRRKAVRGFRVGRTLAFGFGLILGAFLGLYLAFSVPATSLLWNMIQERMVNSGTGEQLE